MFARSKSCQLTLSIKMILLCGPSHFACARIDCTMDSTLIHGENIVEEDVEKIKCPHDGAVTSIDVSYVSVGNDQRLSSISFYCVSSDGTTHYGPFGNVTGRKETLACSDHQHVSYLYGRAGSFLNEIQVVCAQSGVPTVQVKDKKLLSGSETFNDSCYAENGRRTKSFTILLKEYIHGIAVKYYKKGVSVNCKKSFIELINVDKDLQIVDFQILGLTIGSSCSNLTQQLCLSVIDSTSVENTSGRTTSVETKTAFSTYTNALWGVWVDHSGGVERYIGGTYNIEHLNIKDSPTSTANSEEVERSQKTVVSFQAPGAAVVVGYRTRYVIPKTETKVRYHYTCEVGSYPPAGGTMQIQGEKYGNVHFQDYYFPIDSAICTIKVRVCISRIKFESYVLHPKLLQAELEVKIKECLL